MNDFPFFGSPKIDYVCYVSYVDAKPNMRFLVQNILTLLPHVAQIIFLGLILRGPQFISELIQKDISRCCDLVVRDITQPAPQVLVTEDSVNLLAQRLHHPK